MVRSFTITLEAVITEINLLNFSFTSAEHFSHPPVSNLANDRGFLHSGSSSGPFKPGKPGSPPENSAMALALIQASVNEPAWVPRAL